MVVVSAGWRTVVAEVEVTAWLWVDLAEAAARDAVEAAEAEDDRLTDVVP